MLAVSGLIATLIALSACGDAPKPVLVFAAASLADPLTELVQRFEDETGARVDLSFGGSNSLARQIIAGAPADLFVCAGVAPVDSLIAEGLAEARGVQELFGNQLVVVTGPGLGPFASLRDLLGSTDRLALVDPMLGPAGLYAQQALSTEGLWDALLPNIVLTQDVRAALAYVAAGNADAGIVYRTDALTQPDLTVAYAVPSDLHAPIRYVVVVPIESDRQAEGARLLRFLASEESARTFQSYGFVDAKSAARLVR